MEVFDNIPFELDFDTLLQRTHVEPGTEDAKEFKRLVERARTQVKPKALFKECYIQAKDADSVTIDGVTFRSRSLRANLDKPERVFVYVATCGREADQIALPKEDFLMPFWLDAIKATLLGISISYLTSYLNRRYALGKTATMSPGSGDTTVWPIEQQRELFSLLGDVTELIGVELTDSFLMVPNKTVSGIRFPTEIDFHSCQLCHREACPSRSAPFDQELWESIEQGMESETEQLAAPDKQ